VVVTHVGIYGCMYLAEGCGGRTSFGVEMFTR
jgi:hypothetical protein